MKKLYTGVIEGCWGTYYEKVFAKNKEEATSKLEAKIKDICCHYLIEVIVGNPEPDKTLTISFEDISSIELPTIRRPLPSLVDRVGVVKPIDNKKERVFHFKVSTKRRKR